MYNDGSISHRLREVQREADTAYARVHFINKLLGDAQEKIRDLERRLERCEESQVERETISNDSGKPSKPRTPKA
jgi:HEPN domain-containing protein